MPGYFEFSMKSAAVKLNLGGPILCRSYLILLCGWKVRDLNQHQWGTCVPGGYSAISAKLPRVLFNGSCEERPPALLSVGATMMVFVWRAGRHTVISHGLLPISDAHSAYIIDRLPTLSRLFKDTVAHPLLQAAQSGRPFTISWLCTAFYAHCWGDIWHN